MTAHSDEFRDCFLSLAGKWVMSRTVSSGETVRGELVFDPSGDGRYRAIEHGELQLADGNRINANRTWIWEQDGSVLSIFFDENPVRLYHRFAPIMEDGIWCGAALHHCSPDNYEGRYRFLPNVIEIDQKITGPKKDYSISTRYSRK